jgi:GT2 family glycosyltransferase
VASEHPEWQFVLLGGVFEIDVSTLEALPNVHLLGQQPYELIPLYLYHFDVCIIPFKINEITNATDPVKLYEYLSVGKPVVATMMPEVQVYSDVVYLAHGPTEFGHRIEEALADLDPKSVERRISVARQHTWAERWERIDAAIRSVTPRASIILVTFNSVEHTKLCLTSVLANTDDPSYEVIVVDNGSTDGTIGYLRHISREHPRIRVILNGANFGFAAANNIGLAEATGDVLILLNNDTLVTRGWLTRLRAYLADEKNGLVGPVSNFVGNEARVEVPYTTYDELETWVREYTDAHTGKAFDIKMLAMFCLAMRRDTFEKIGPLDEQFGIGMFEDDDYAIRARQAGYRVVCAEGAFVHHFGQASFGKLIPTGDYQDLWDRNQRLFEKKWGTAWEAHQGRAEESSAEGDGAGG